MEIKMKLLNVVIIINILLLLLLPNAGAFTIKYDLYFQRWGNFYFPSQDWKHWKAQGLAESKLNPKALSYCGAIGILQLMPATAKSLGVNPFDEEANIQGGIKYDNQISKYWIQISYPEKLRFIFGSYNSGPGHIIKSRKQAQSDKWEEVAKQLPLITGIHAKETIEYVQRIEKFYGIIR
jgi:membrane-bound lytic murein transglycosylase MltF